MDYLSVRNWTEFQHYKDRNPPWIKLHKSLLHDYDFSRLQDASKAHLVLIWLLASQLENQIPNDPEWIKAQTGISGKLNLNLLIDSGFLVASNALADCKQSATLSVSVSGTKDSSNKRSNSKKRATQIPSDWLPSEKTLVWAKDKFQNIDAPAEVDAFIDYWQGEGVGKADWNATFKNRIRNIDKRMQENRKTRPRTNGSTPRESAHEKSQRIIRERADEIAKSL